MHHHRKLILVMFVVSLIHAHYAIRVDTDVNNKSTDTEKSESVDDQQQLPKAEALTLIVHKRVPLRPLKVVERKDDVVVIHTNKRSKRKQNSRPRRPPSNQYRSKIKHSSSGSSFGGFKDFSPNDLRFPPFSSKPARASSNKLKYGPPKSSPPPSYDFNSQPQRRPSSHRQQQQQPSQVSSIYGPPSLNHIETPYIQPITLQQQQQQHSFPQTFSLNAVEPVSTNFFINDDLSKFTAATPISKFPLGDGSNFNIPKTSYGEPVRSASNNHQSAPVDTTSYSFNSNVVNALNQLNKINSQKVNTANTNNFPKLPSKYETSDFSTPTRHNPLNSNSYSNDFQFDLLDTKTSSNTKQPNRYQTNDNNFGSDFSYDPQETKISSNSNNFRPQSNRFNKFNNYDYDFRNQKNPSLPGIDIDDDDDDDDDDTLEYLYSTRRPTTTTTTEYTTTTRKFKKGIFGKRKRPVKLSQEHNLDTDDLRDAFSEPTNHDFHEVSLNSDDFLNFDSQRNERRKNQNAQQQQHEIHSTLKIARKNPALRTALGDNFQILNIQKSIEKDPSTVDHFFQRRRDNGNDFTEFKVGGDLTFSDTSSVMWNGDMNNKPRNHRF